MWLWRRRRRRRKKSDGEIRIVMVGRILLEKENGANRRQGRDRQKKQWSLMFMDCVLNLMRNRKLRNSPNDEVSTPVQRKHIKPKITLRKKVMCTLHDTN